MLSEPRSGMLVLEIRAAGVQDLGHYECEVRGQNFQWVGVLGAGIHALYSSFTVSELEISTQLIKPHIRGGALWLPFCQTMSGECPCHRKLQAVLGPLKDARLGTLSLVARLGFPTIFLQGPGFRVL